MAKLIMMRGLPASGKTTRARTIMKESGNFIRVNKDDLRAMLHVGDWNGRKEKITKRIQQTAVSNLLASGENVIVDDTNLTARDEKRWSGVASNRKAKFEIIDMDVDMHECIDRDADRENSVGEHVVTEMALRNKLYKPEKGYVLCDIDGTVANLDHRLHYVKGDRPDWKGFFAEMDKDTLIKENLDTLIKLHEEGYEVLMVSGRPDTYRDVTEQWLYSNGVNRHCAVLMRRGNDCRPDTDVKRDIMNIIGKENIHCVIDDRPCVVRMWKEEGVEVIDVGNGVEF